MWRWILLPLPLLVLVSLPEPANSHGRLIEPPSRASMWRYGFDTPPDYNDHELYCGGFSRQWQRNKGKCGICGDPWDTSRPRSHEMGGTYGSGLLVRRYLVDSIITIRVELTANHRGYFEFRLCPNNDNHTDATQECLDRYLLRRGERTNDEHESRLYPGPGNKVFGARYRLPRGFTCSHCVLQWRYIAGNNWGMCANGTGAVGCGPQEEFRACADVAVVDEAGLADSTPWTPAVQPPEEGEDLPVDDKTSVFVLVTVLCTFAAAAMAFALVYLYFYHAGDHIKRWLAARRKTAPSDLDSVTVPLPIPVAPAPAPPPRLKRSLHA